MKKINIIICYIVAILLLINIIIGVINSYLSNQTLTILRSADEVEIQEIWYE